MTCLSILGLGHKKAYYKKKGIMNFHDQGPPRDGDVHWTDCCAQIPTCMCS